MAGHCKDTAVFDAYAVSLASRNYLMQHMSKDMKCWYLVAVWTGTCSPCSMSGCQQPLLAKTSWLRMFILICNVIRIASFPECGNEMNQRFTTSLDFTQLITMRAVAQPLLADSDSWLHTC
jgi:hypothetical protein